MLNNHITIDANGRIMQQYFHVSDSASKSAGKFLAAFSKKYLPWNFVSESKPQTWKQLADRFKEELPSLLVNIDVAQRGHA